MFLFPLTITAFISCQATPEETEAPVQPSVEESISNRIESGGTLIELDLSQAERLLNILSPSPDIPIHFRAFHLDSVQGESIQYKDIRSPAMVSLKSLVWAKSEDMIFVHAQNELRQQFHIYNNGWLSSPEFVDLLERVDFSDDRFLINVQQPSHQQLMAFYVDKFIEGPTFVAIESSVLLKSGNLILNIEQEEGFQLVKFDGQQFEMLEQGDRISKLKLSPDEKSYTYTVTKSRKTFYGVGTELYTRSPVWKELSNAYAYLGTDDAGQRVVVDYTPLKVYGQVSNFKNFDGNNKIHFIGKNDDGFTVHQINEEQKDVYSKPYSKAPSLNSHFETNELYWVGQTDEGFTLSIVASGSKLKSSGTYEKISIQPRIKHATQPVAIASTSEGINHVLTGPEAGPGFEKIDQLQTMLKQTDVLYVGQKTGKHHVVQGAKTGEGFDKIHSLGLTVPSGKAYYHASLEDKNHFVYETTKSKSFLKISRIIKNQLDDVAWQGDAEQEAYIGLNTNLGEGFDSIISAKFTPKGVLWYDAKRNEKLYRAVDSKALGPFDSMTTPILSSASKSLLFAARAGKEQSKGVAVTDTIYKGNGLEKSYEYALSDVSAGQRWLKGTDLPKLQLFSDSDSYFYVAKQPEQSHVGMNTNSWGPFEDVKYLKRWPQNEKVVFASKKNDIWAVNANDDKRKDVDEVASLGFTLDLKKLKYDVKIAGDKFVFIGTDRYQKVRYEQLTPRKNIHTFQAQKDDKWMLIVDYQTSTPFKDLERTRFTPDSYGIEAIGKTADGKKLIRKLYDKDFDYSEAFDSLSSTRYYHFPIKPYTARKIVVAFTETELVAIEEGTYTGPLWLQLEDENQENVAVDTIDTKNMFLSVSSSISRISSGYLFSQVDEDNNRFVLHGLQNIRNLRQTASTRPMVLQLHDRPYTIKATHNRKTGVVHSNKFFTRLESPHTNYFTENGHFHAIGRGLNDDFFIVDHGHSEGFNAIQGLSYSTLEADIGRNRLVLLTYNNDRRNPWYELVLIDNSLNSEKLEGAKEIDSTRVRRRSTFQINTPNIEWIGLNGRSASTVVWQGQSHRRFVSVHNERYDAISDEYSDSSGTLEFYMGHRDGLSSIYSKDSHHPWYTEITEVSHSTDGYPIYLAHQEYQYANEHERTKATVTTFKDNKRLSRLIHGDQSGPWQDSIHALFPKDQFDHCVYVGARDGLAQIYTGGKAIFNSYDDIGWVHLSLASTDEVTQPTQSTEPEIIVEKAIPDTNIHFLAREGDNWIEIHNGQKSNTFDGLESLQLASDIPESYTRLEHGARLLPEVYIDSEGRYFYRAKVGSKDAIVHQGQRSDAVEGLKQVWLNNDGEVMAFKNELYDGFQVYAAGALSDVYLSVSDPMYQPYSQNYNFIATLAAPEILEIDNDRWFSFEDPEQVDKILKDKELADEVVDKTLYERVILLHNTEPSHAAWHAMPIRTSAGIPAFHLNHQDRSSSIWLNGKEGPAVDSINESNAYWGESLETSRYAAVIDEQFHVAGENLKHGPFDELSSIELLDTGELGSWIWNGRLGNITSLYVDDELYDQAHSISTDLNVSGETITYRAQQAHSKKHRRGMDRYNQMMKFNIETTQDQTIDMLRLEDAGLNWFEVSELVSEKSDILYLLHHQSDTETGEEKLVWLGGIVDQDLAKLNITLNELILGTKSEDDVLRPLEPVDALADAEEGTEG